VVASSLSLGRVPGHPFSSSLTLVRAHRRIAHGPREGTPAAMAGGASPTGRQMEELMRKAVTLGIALIVVAGCGGEQPSAETDSALSTPVALYRLHYTKTWSDNWYSWPKYSEDHFYTTNFAEAQAAQSQYGYVSEGVVGTCAATQEANTVPLYRLYSNDANAHFYTTNQVERANAINQYGYRDEGITCYVYTDQVPGSCALHRFETLGLTGLGFNYLYTESYSEGASAVPLDKSMPSYHYDGIAAFLLPYNQYTCPN
jgi:hypothetical protein